MSKHEIDDGVVRWEFALSSQAPSKQVKSGVEALERLGAERIFATEVPIGSIDGEKFSSLARVERIVATNCIVIVGLRGQKRILSALVIPGGERADLNGRVRKLLGVRLVSLAGEEFLESTGMQKGAVGPIGLPADWPIWVDESLRSKGDIYCGGGALQCKLKLRVEDLALLPQVHFASLVQAR